MANKIASFSAAEPILEKARVRANLTERGNFSAYIEKLIIRDLQRAATDGKRRVGK
jgi:hypothetical protein